jgi:hypothetical protein
MTLFEYLHSTDLTIAIVNIIGGMVIGYLIWGRS